MKAQHLVQTRFSVRAKWGYQEEFPLDWLEERLRLFDTYCLPSVAGQTRADFLWLVYCDESTDPDVMGELRDRERAVEQMRIVSTGRGPLLAAVRPLFDLNRPIATTRLDSDDAIHARWIETVQARSGDQSEGIWLLNFPRGYKLDDETGALYLEWNPRAAFYTMFEPDARTARTVLSQNHSRIHELYPVTYDDSLAAWLQVIHGGNLRNKLRTWAPEADKGRLAEFGLEETATRPLH